ncbi:hypothetical protein FUAX_14310 [Fulvitalea axinellae]|uniref:ComEC family competence protein n=1 Tax=Fulvitalea axinellae TaxID=1182444 RepID=A0AAU9CAA8_9BACT|nr:hypothetical protein FUAX_14310 [Fulvitalea axinellae]
MTFGKHPLSFLLLFAVLAISCASALPKFSYPTVSVIFLALLTITYGIGALRKFRKPLAIFFTAVGVFAIYALRTEKQTREHSTIPQGNYLKGKVTQNKGKYLIVAFQNDNTRLNCVCFGKSIISEKIQPGSLIYTKATPTPLRPPSNPGAFDFKAFMNRKGVFHSVYLTKGSYSTSPPEFGLTSIFDKIRHNTSENIHKSFSAENGAIVHALLLGKKSELSKDTRKLFSSAGTAHLLAVSGLHVGIIYGALLFLFRSWRKQPKYRLMFLFVVLLSLLSFCLLTGMPASAARASVMFGLLAIGDYLHRDSVPLNTLCGTALIMLFINPLWLYDLGFQLSFLAIAGILTIYPALSSIFNPKKYLPRKIWQALCVSTAAQIATLPLILFHFGTFPTYFLLSNLLAVPIISVCTILSSVYIFIQEFSWLSTPFTWCIEQLLNICRHILVFINQLPASTIQLRGFGIIELISTLSITIMALAFPQRFRKFRWALIPLMSAVALTVRGIQPIKPDKLVVYKTKYGPTLDLISERARAFINLHTTIPDTASFPYYIANTRIGLSEKQTPSMTLKGVRLYTVNGNTFGIIDNPTPAILDICEKHIDFNLFLKKPEEPETSVQSLDGTWIINDFKPKTASFSPKKHWMKTFGGKSIELIESKK